MEALALRRPVVTTYVAGIPELVCDGENGWLVSAGLLRVSDIRYPHLVNKFLKLSQSGDLNRIRLAHLH